MAFQYCMQEWNAAPSSAGTYSEKSTSCFDCNICLNFASDPVVTLCGHLYCWPCIYKWVDSQSASLSSGQLSQCPVCKAETSEKTLVPLYGRGQSLPEPQQGETIIPPRPPASGIQGFADLSEGQRTIHDPYQNLHYFPYDNYNNTGDLVPTLSNLRGIAPLVLSYPVAEILGGMVYGRVFGNSTSLYAYTYPNSYHSQGRSTPRLRRRELLADKSLNRVTIFLFCCLLLCLLLF